ncbi:hypothetical protein ACEPAG_6847 [Sanghuangporus baumii]
MKHTVAIAPVLALLFADSAFSLAARKPTPTDAIPTVTSNLQPRQVSCPNSTKFQFFGVNESGAEFGQNVIPGAEGTDYTWPSPSSIDYFVNAGFNTFRVPFLMERLSPPSNGLAGSFDLAYLQGLKNTVSYITRRAPMR